MRPDCVIQEANNSICWLKNVEFQWFVYGNSIHVGVLVYIKKMGDNVKEICKLAEWLEAQENETSTSKKCRKIEIRWH